MSANKSIENFSTSPTKIKRHWRLKIITFLVIIFLCVLCFGVLSFLWFGGFVKQGICGAVTSDSQIYQKLSCAVNVTETQQKFPLAQSNPNQNIEQKFVSEEGIVMKVVDDTSSGVVGIGISGDNSTADKVIGTGFIVSKAGLLVTNRHVVENEKVNYFVVFKDQQITVKVKSENIFKDPVNDIALIKLNAEEIPLNVKIIPIGNSDNIKLGATVIAIGNPLGKYTGTITKGIVSGLHREVNITQGFFTTQNEVYADVIQTDAAINPGNSGGPMINLNGEAIGINFATIEGAANLSFALPINRVKLRIAELEQFNKFKIPYLGVEYRTGMNFIQSKSVVGAEIVSVVVGSPAASSGLQKGDMIIEFDGQNLSDKTLSSLIQNTKIGEQVSVVILRNKVQQELTVTIGER